MDLELLLALLDDLLAPVASSRLAIGVLLKLAHTEKVSGSAAAPTRSITAIHDTPVNRLNPAASISSKISVPPVNPSNRVKALLSATPRCPPGARQWTCRLYRRIASSPLLATSKTRKPTATTA